MRGKILAGVVSLLLAPACLTCAADGWKPSWSGAGLAER